MNKKQAKKKIDGGCYFCNEKDYSVLDTHRIIPGADGGKYNGWNELTVCANCHRKCHSGKIKIKGKFLTSSGKYVIIFEEDGEEKIK